MEISHEADEREKTAQPARSCARESGPRKCDARGDPQNLDSHLSFALLDLQASKEVRKDNG